MNGIAAVAAKFQDRASQLVSEQATLDLNLEKLKEVQSKLRQEELDNRKARLEMLTSVCKRQTIELDLMKLEDEIVVKERCVAQDRDEVEKLQAKIEHMRRYAATLEAYYSTHTTETDLFRRIFEGEIRQKEQDAEQREQTLRNLLRNSEQVKLEIEDVNRQTEQLIQEQRQLELQAELEDEEIAAIGMQIKATLSKVRTFTSFENIFFYYRGLTSALKDL
jgi:chromosome segregation ATPase